MINKWEGVRSLDIALENGNKKVLYQYYRRGYFLKIYLIITLLVYKFTCFFTSSNLLLHSSRLLARSRASSASRRSTSSCFLLRSSNSYRKRGIELLLFSLPSFNFILLPLTLLQLLRVKLIGWLFCKIFTYYRKGRLLVEQQTKTGKPLFFIIRNKQAESGPARKE